MGWDWWTYMSQPTPFIERIEFWYSQEVKDKKRQLRKRKRA